MTTEEKTGIEKVCLHIKNFLDKKCKKQGRLVTLTRHECVIAIRWHHTANKFYVECWRYSGLTGTTLNTMEEIIQRLLYLANEYTINCLECRVNNNLTTCIFPTIEPVLLDEYYAYIQGKNDTLDKNIVEGESVAKDIKEEKKNIMVINHYENLKQLLQLHNTIKDKDTRKVIFYKAGVKNTPELILYKINDDDFDLIAANNNKIYSSLDYENAFNMIMERIKNKEIYYEF